MLAWTIYISFIGAALLMLLPAGKPRPARYGALLIALLGLAVAVAGVLNYGGKGGGASTGSLIEITNIPWIESLHIRFHLAMDGVSATLILLTGLAAVVGVLFSWNIDKRTKEFFALYLALIGGVYGVFLSFDLFLLFVFYEIAIIPKYFLIAIWGSTRREYGAMKLALYSFIGSAMVMVGLIATFIVAKSSSFDLVTLSKFPFPPNFQCWAFLLIFVGFAILAGMWPFHTWAPTGHVAAPTAASMLLAGVVMKLGAYGALRVAMILFPQGLLFWQIPIAILATIGIVYGAMVALVQRDFKFVIGYSSVSHMGFVLLGLVTLTSVGLSGAVLQMFSHGIIAGLLFAVVGRMVYDRTHTRDLTQLGPMNLSKVLPFATITFVLGGAASMGLPGFSGFVAEFQVLQGALQALPVFGIFAGIGIIVGVAYTLRALLKAFYTESSGSHELEHAHPLDPITLPEKIGAIILLTATLAIGVYPRLLLDLIVPTINSPLFAPLVKGGLS